MDQRERRYVLRIPTAREVEPDEAFRVAVASNAEAAMRTWIEGRLQEILNAGKRGDGEALARTAAEMQVGKADA